MARKTIFVLTSVGRDAYGEIGGKYGAGVEAITDNPKTAKIWHEALFLDESLSLEYWIQEFEINSPEQIRYAHHELVAGLTFDGDYGPKSPTLSQAIRWRRKHNGKTVSN